MGELYITPGKGAEGKRIFSAHVTSESDSVCGIDVRWQAGQADCQITVAPKYHYRSVEVVTHVVEALRSYGSAVLHNLAPGVMGVRRYASDFKVEVSVDTGELSEALQIANHMLRAVSEASNGNTDPLSHLSVGDQEVVVDVPFATRVTPGE